MHPLITWSIPVLDILFENPFPSAFLNHYFTAETLQLLFVLSRFSLCFCLISPTLGILSFQGLFGPKIVVLFLYHAPFLAWPVCFSTPKELICIPTKTLTELWEYFWSMSEIVTQ